MNSIKICHLTSAHNRYDIRIFVKMCKSLVKHNFNVFLVVSDGLDSTTKDNISIINVGTKNTNRLSRMTKTVFSVYLKAIEIDADIYHLHDPELIPIGLKLKKKGKKVIFDAHEDLPRQILSKPYLNKVSKAVLSRFLELYEKLTCHKFDAIVTATKSIEDKFLKINKNTVCINNYPLLDELLNDTAWSKKKNEIIYVGGITKIRSIVEIVKSMEYTKGVKLNLVGKFDDINLKNQLKACDGWSKINESGFLNREDVRKNISQSKVGIVVFKNFPNHVNAQPNKMFEYMGSGIPVIASDFPLWKEIIVDNKCGICVNPLEPKEIGESIQFLIDHPRQAEKMGQNGRKMIETKYNWLTEEKRLVKLYKGLLKNENINNTRGKATVYKSWNCK